MWSTDIFCDLEVHRKQFDYEILWPLLILSCSVLWKGLTFIFLHAFQQVRLIYAHGLDNVWTLSSLGGKKKQTYSYLNSIFSSIFKSPHKITLQNDIIFSLFLSELLLTAFNLGSLSLSFLRLTGFSSIVSLASRAFHFSWRSLQAAKALKTYHLFIHAAI